MHDPLSMCLVKGIRNLNRVAKRLVERQRSLLQSIRQRLPLDVLQNHVVEVPLVADLSAGALAKVDVMERADVRVVQAGDGTGFPLKSFFEPGVIGKVRRENLDRDRAVKPGVPGLVDLPLPPGPEGREDFVGTQFRSRSE